MNGDNRFYLTFDDADDTKNIITSVKLNNGFLLESVIPITEKNKILFQNGCIFIMNGQFSHFFSPKQCD